MKITSRILFGSMVGVAFLLPPPTAMAAAKEARVTQIIREVKLLPSEAAERPAAVNDKVSEDTGVKTGGDSRSELTFPDLTITRLGSNTIFSFSKAGRTAKVDSGSILLRVPKDSGGGTIRNNAVTVAVTGTTVIFEGSRSTKSKTITLEGSARVSLTSKPREFRNVLAGQMLDVPAGATTLPMPVNIDLNDVMRKHPLITGFKPLPSQPLIMAAAQRPPPPAPPPPRTTGPNINIDIFGGGFNPLGPRRPTRPPGNRPPADDSTTRPPTTNQSPGSTKPPPTPPPRPQRSPTKPTPPPGPR
jgi:FecR protein